ncbi:uncharacterized protein LOC110733967 [Chenopodium quinoa]|uniref:uncharacterized protein LOC110733967 n=1 Tax=Chenopodium quinoa TaxID=63459 RepID=UPI000B78DFC7|nr:uncharacterized protein LOC110733967 [Chenopodium quinoa]
MFFGKPAIIKAWNANFDFHSEILRSIPIWVKLPNLPLNCWSVNTLSRIGSTLEGEVIELKDQFEWHPPFCKGCNRVGHDCSASKNQVKPQQQGDGSNQPNQVHAQKKAWVPKQVNPVPATESVAMAAVNEITPEPHVQKPKEWQDRKQLWSGLKELIVSITPWLCIGDFNSILGAPDRLNGAAFTDYETRDFQQCIDELALVEIKSKGASYSWSNKAHSGPRTCSRIDRGLVNQEWLNLYGHVEAIFLPPPHSDHSPIALDILPSQSGKGRPFRYLNCLADHDNFLSSVATAWQALISGSAMSTVWHKLKRVKSALKSLNTQKFGDVNAKVEAAHNLLISIQHQISEDVTNTELQVKELEAIEAVKKWVGIQESIYKQKSRVDWLQLGDGNNKYFFSVMKHRQSRNRIDSLYTDQDILLRTPADIEEELTGFYKNILSSKAISLPCMISV